MAAMQTTNSADDMGRRIDELARPKRFASGFDRDRRSIYWVEREPPTPGKDGVTVIIASARVQQLAQHRDPVSQWRGDRMTPMWPVSQSAQHATSSERLVTLAQHRDANPQHRLERSPYMAPTPAACSATSTHRLEQLATPKNRTDPFETRQNQWGQYYPVPLPALSAKATERVDQLAEPKKDPEEFHGEKPVQWPVSEQALKSLASLRLQQLSRPHSRTMIRDDFDPYKVSPAARKTHPTPRLEELAVPIPRKVKSKKV